MDKWLIISQITHPQTCLGFRFLNKFSQKLDFWMKMSVYTPQRDASTQSITPRSWSKSKTSNYVGYVMQFLTVPVLTEAQLRLYFHAVLLNAVVLLRLSHFFYLHRLLLPIAFSRNLPYCATLPGEEESHLIKKKYIFEWFLLCGILNHQSNFISLASLTICIYCVKFSALNFKKNFQAFNMAFF